MDRIQSLNEKGVFVVIGESMLGSRIDSDEFENIRILRTILIQSTIIHSIFQ